MFPFNNFRSLVQKASIWKSLNTRFPRLCTMELNSIHHGNLNLLNGSLNHDNTLNVSTRPSHSHTGANNMNKSEDLSERHQNGICKTEQRKRCRVFVQILNPVLGKWEWEVQAEDYDYTKQVARSAYADMLHDDERNELYYTGLRDAVERVRRRGERVLVLDIGTGTGLLSMMAVACGADVVTACEAFEPMAKCAEKILAANNMRDKVRVIHKRSTEMEVGPGLDMEEPANILVAEVFDTELIGEGAISTYNHAMEHLLTADALLVPSAGRVYAQVVSSPQLHSFSRPNAIVPLNFPQLHLPPSFASCPGSMSVHDIQMSQLSTHMFTPVSDPIEVFSFDWSGRDIKLTCNERTHNVFTPKLRKQNQSNNNDKYQEALTCHAVLMWWDITMDQEGKHILSCAPHWEQSSSTGPNSVPWRDHWMQAVYHLPPPLVTIPRNTNNDVTDRRRESQQSLTLTSSRDEYSLWFSVSAGDSATVVPAPHCSCGVHMTTSHTRLAQLSDQRRLEAMQTAIDSTLLQQEGRDEKAWLLLGDGINLFIVGKLATDNRVSHVYLVEASKHDCRVMAEFLSLNKLQDRVTIQPKKTKDDTIASVLEHKIGVVFSEPHFNTSLLPWHNIRSNKLMAQYRDLLPSPPTSGITPLQINFNKNKDFTEHLPSMTGAIVLPARITVYAMPVCFLNLWKIRAPCEQRCGFDLTIFDELIDTARCRSDDYVEAQPLWEYPCIALHAPVALTSLDLRTDAMAVTATTDASVQLDTAAISRLVPHIDAMRNSCYGTRGGSCLSKEASLSEANTSESPSNLSDGKTVSATSSQVHFNGVAVWADWQFGEKSITTGPVEEVVLGEQVVWDMYSKQGVHLPRESVPLLQRSSSGNLAPKLFTSSVTIKDGQLSFSFNVRDYSQHH